MIRARSSCPNTSSAPLAWPSTYQPPDSLYHKWRPIRADVIGNGSPRCPAHALGRPHPEVELLLPGRDPLSRNSLQQLQLDIIVRRPDVLDIVAATNTRSATAAPPTRS